MLTMERGLLTVDIAKRGPSRSAGKGEETSTQAYLNEDRITSHMGGEARDPRESRGNDGCVILLGKSYQGRSERKDTLTMIANGVEI